MFPLLSLGVLGASLSVYLLMFPLLVILKFSRMIYILLALEYFSLLLLYFFWAGLEAGGFHSSMGFLVLGGVVLEASVGVGLLVSLVRWENKVHLVSA